MTTVGGTGFDEVRRLRAAGPGPLGEEEATRGKAADRAVAPLAMEEVGGVGEGAGGRLEDCGGRTGGVGDMVGG